MVTMFKNVKGEFCFNAKAKNGEIVALGEGYKSKQTCLKGISAAKKAFVGKVQDLTK